MCGAHTSRSQCQCLEYAFQSFASYSCNFSTIIITSCANLSFQIPFNYNSIIFLSEGCRIKMDGIDIIKCLQAFLWPKKHEMASNFCTTEGLRNQLFSQQVQHSALPSWCRCFRLRASITWRLRWSGWQLCNKILNDPVWYEILFTGYNKSSNIDIKQNENRHTNRIA